MAEIVDDTAWETIRNYSGHRKYPWDVWLDGKTRILTRGEDFTCTATSMQNNINVRAFRMGKTIRTRILDRDHVQLKAESGDLS